MNTKYIINYLYNTFDKNNRFILLYWQISINYLLYYTYNMEVKVMFS